MLVDCENTGDGMRWGALPADCGWSCNEVGLAFNSGAINELKGGTTQGWVQKKQKRQDEALNHLQPPLAQRNISASRCRPSLLQN